MFGFGRGINGVYVIVRKHWTLAMPFFGSEYFSVRVKMCAKCCQSWIVGTALRSSDVDLIKMI